MLKLLIISVTWHTPQNKVSDTITHVTLNTIKDVDTNDCLLFTNFLFMYM